MQKQTSIPPKKQLTEKELKSLRMTLQISPIGNAPIYYSLGKKDSNSGLFTNERLLLLHTGECSLRYYSQLPKGIPFTHYQEIVQGKEKIMLLQVQNFKCQAMKGKVSTLQIEWQKNKEKRQWVFIMGNHKLMNDWLQIVNQTIKKAKQPKNNQATKISSHVNNPNDKNFINNSNANKPNINQNNPNFIINNQQTNRNTLDDTFPNNYRINPNATQPIQSSIQSKNYPQSQAPKQFYDVPGEIKQLRKDHQSRFNLTNELENPVPQKYNNQSFERNNKSMQQSLQSKKNPYKLENSRQKLDPRQRESFLENSKSQQQHMLNSRKNLALSRNGDNTSSRANHYQSYQDPKVEHSRFNRENSNIPKNPSSNRIHVEAAKNYSKKSILHHQNTRKWNQEWCETSAQYKIEIYQQFINECNDIGKKIIDQLPFLRKDRQYAPIQENPPYFIYRYNGIVIVLHYYTEQAHKTRQYNSQAPLLFDYDSYQQTKRQFYNYNLILSVTGNQGFIRVPLCCLIQYKGVLVLCKAQIPINFHHVSAQTYQNQFEDLEEVIKVKFPLSSFTVHVNPTSKYVLLNDLGNLIPQIPNSIKPRTYFCNQYLLNSEDILEDKRSIIEAHHNIIKNNIPQFISKFESLESWIADSNDLNKQLNLQGVSSSYIPQIYQQTLCNHLRKILLTELAAQTFTIIIRSQINHTFAVFPAQDFDNLSVPIIDSIILDGIHVLINQLFSYSLRAQNIWKVIVNQISKKYRVTISKQDLIVGFFLSAILSKNSLHCEFKNSSFNRQSQFFIRQNIIPRDMFIKFYPKIIRYDSSSLSPRLQQVSKIIGDDPTPSGFEEIVSLLNLKSQNLPVYIYELRDQLITYLCNFIPIEDDGQFQHLNIYEQIFIQPHTHSTLKCSLLAIKWAVKRKNIQLALRIFQDKCQQNCFWLGQFNPAISEFYDFFSIYYASVGNYDESIKLAKSSLVNCIKILGPNSLPTADKHYQLGNIFFKVSRKEQALKQYIKTKQILTSHGQTGIPQYGIILLKTSLLYLNFGKIKDCVVNSLEALKIFDLNGGSEQDQIQTFEILTRAYQITRKPNDMMSVGAICSQKFNLTENPKIFQRMMKIVLYPKMSLLNSQQSKSLQSLLLKFQELDSQVTYMETFSYLHRKASEVIIMKKILSLIDNIVSFYDDVMRKNLFKKHKSLNYETKSQAEQMLVLLEGVTIMVGYGFLLGSLKQTYYD